MGSTTLLNKFRNGTYDCYCFLVDYDQMALPWPDGFKDPADRICGQAPIAINDNYFFYGEGGEYVQLVFGQCIIRRLPIENAAAFNRAMVPVAVANEKLEQTYDIISELIKMIENLVRIKHGTTPLLPNKGQSTMASAMAVGFFENVFIRLARNGNKYEIKLAGEESNPGIHFPVKMVMMKNGRPLTIEAMLDELI